MTWHISKVVDWQHYVEPCQSVQRSCSGTCSQCWLMRCAGVGKWVVIHVITWIIGVETIKRQTRAAWCCLVADQSPWARAWTAQPVGSFCDTDTAAAAICSSWRYISVVCLCLTYVQSCVDTWSVMCWCHISRCCIGRCISDVTKHFTSVDRLHVTASR